MRGALRRRDDGSIAPLVPVMGLAVLLLGGLVVDSARLLGNRSRAVAYAEEAARAGAGTVDLGQLELGLDPQTVALQVQEYCDALAADEDLRSAVTYCGLDVGSGDDGIEEVGDGDGRRIVVRARVEMDMPTTLLGLIGVNELSSSGTGRARAFEGVDPRDVDSTPPPVSIEPVPPVPDPEGPITGPSAEPELPLCPSPTPTPSPAPTTAAPPPQPGQPAPPAPVPTPSPSPTCTPAPVP